MPLLRCVRRMEIQSESGPAVKRPINEPTKIAKLKNPASSQQKLDPQNGITCL
jgi:hypothetical protein